MQYGTTPAIEAMDTFHDLERMHAEDMAAAIELLIQELQASVVTD